MKNHIGGVMVSVITLNVIDHGPEIAYSTLIDLTSLELLEFQP
jgi:hypothetical protein